MCSVRKPPVLRPSLKGRGRVQVQHPYLQGSDYLKRTKVTPSLGAGDALLFCNAFFHKSENVHQGKRTAYILRLVPKDAKFSRTRLLGLKMLGQNLAVVNELLEQHYPDALETL